MSLTRSAPQNLLRGLVPDSFPSRLGLSPIEGPGQRRFVIIDDTVSDIYGQQLENVRASSFLPSCCRAAPCPVAPALTPALAPDAQRCPAASWQP